MHAGDIEDLRSGKGWLLAEFGEDNGSFAHATMRCVWAGKCRDVESGVMCPSYMVTLEERRNTRGRARILHELLRGQAPIEDGFKSEEVFDSLDLCLSCKGCKSDCPVDVDMVTYKAEFLSRYYKGKLRPRYAYTMGLIMLHARVAAYTPGTRRPGNRAAGKEKSVIPDTQTPVLFLGVSLAITLAPGADMLYVVSRGVAQGRTAALVSAAAVNTGSLIHLLFAVLGLSLLLEQSAVAFYAVKYAGAAYLVYLGARILLDRDGLRPSEGADRRMAGTAALLCHRDEDLRCAFFPTRSTRVLDALGYVRFLDWRLYGEEALPKREVAVWLQPDNLTLEYGGRPLSSYDVELSRETGKPEAVGGAKLFGTVYALPQFRLFPSDDAGWLKAMKLEGYAPRRSAGPMALQEVLFPYLDAL